MWWLRESWNKECAKLSGNESGQTERCNLPRYNGKSFNYDFAKRMSTFLFCDKSNFAVGQIDGFVIIEFCASTVSVLHEFKWPRFGSFNSEPRVLIALEIWGTVPSI